MNEVMSNNASNFFPFDALSDDEGQLNEARQTSAIHILPTNGNGKFHVTSVMLHMFQMKGLYRGQAYEDPNVHLKKFVEVCAPFNIAHITQ